MSEPFAYDIVEYPSSGLPQMHPGLLHAIARMFGCDPAPVDRCRYLEFGCGDGTHLIACAVGMPDATFVGVDLSAVAIERGNRLITELGLRNVQLHAADITSWTPPAGEFDYACAYGLYSWVPPVVREALLAGIHTALAPHGIGFVSYNTYPGSHVRQMVWDMMKHHTAHVSDPQRKFREATDLLKFVLGGIPVEGRTPPVAAFAHEADFLLTGRHPAVVYHDDLSPVNDPVYFHEFVAHAGRHGLRFVAEAEHTSMETNSYPPVVAGVLNGMAAKDVTLREQYHDYLRLRRFRNTILAKDGRPPRARPDPARIAPLAVSGRLTVEGDTTDLTSPATVAFRCDETMVQTDQPLGKAALLTLAELGPKRIPFAELATATVNRLGRTEPTAADLTRLASLLTEAWMEGVVELNGHIPEYADRVSERPTACPFARAYQVSGGMVTTRLFSYMKFTDGPTLRLLQLLDGTHTHDEIAAGMLDAYPPADRPDPAALRADLADRLQQMARNGLLVG